MSPEPEADRDNEPECLGICAFADGMCSGCGRIHAPPPEKGHRETPGRAREEPGTRISPRARGPLGSLLLATVLLLSHQPALANTFDDGMVAYMHGDYDAALTIWKPLVKPDSDDSLSQFVHGVMAELGKGAPQNDQEAVNWYRLAADQDFAPAQYRLGLMYQRGRGIFQSYQEAAKLFRAAAMANFVPAQGALAVLYRDGNGVVQNLVQAYLWFAIAGNFEDRDNTGELMTPDQISDAEKQVDDLRLKLKKSAGIR